MFSLRRVNPSEMNTGRTVCVFLLLAVLFGGLLSAAVQSISDKWPTTSVPTSSTNQALTDPPRGVPGDLWADVVIGKPDFSEVTPNQVTHDRLFRPGGVLVDRSVRPNRIYVYDGGNSRVLGLSHIGMCLAGPQAGQNCTANSDCPNSMCSVRNGIGADLVLGQPALTDYSACNGDGNYQNYPNRTPASAATLCSMPEDQVSLLEGGSHANMAVDSAGNLYVPDFDNHRALRYNSPFTADTVADYVWGQDDLAGNLCNKGRGINQPDASSLCFRSPTNDGFVGGVGLDPLGNLWITDNQNNRVLRFPRDPVTGIPTHTADLVLGQPNFISANRGSAMNQMSAPAAVRVDISGTVYVADSRNDRVLIFDPPLTSGMAAGRTLGSGLRLPAGLEFDLGGGIWVHDSENNQLLLFVDGVVQKVLFKDVPNFTGMCGGNYIGDGPLFMYADGSTADPSNVCDARGSIGIDVDGNIFVAANTFVHDVWRFLAPFPNPTPGVARSANATLFTPYQFALQNYVGLKGLFAPRGVAVINSQLIVADERRILFWNNAPTSLVNGKAADGYVGPPNPFVHTGPPFGRIRADRNNRLWVLRDDTVEVYSLPLTTGAAPIKAITSPLPLRGGGMFTWTDSLSIGGITTIASGDKVWIADPRNHRVFRIRDAIVTPTVDVVLGQLNASGIECNQGRGPGFPTQDSLCHPGAVALDPHGNLFISDHALEVEGNHRLLEYDATLFPDSPVTAVFGISATQVFGTEGSFTGPCVPTLCGPWEPAFDSTGRMVVGFNAYIGSRFPVLYEHPLTDTLSYTFINDFHSMAYGATFDADDNLYITDLNRSRVLIYYQNQLGLNNIYLPIILK